MISNRPILDDFRKKRVLLDYAHFVSAVISIFSEMKETRFIWQVPELLNAKRLSQNVHLGHFFSTKLEDQMRN